MEPSGGVSAHYLHYDSDIHLLADKLNLRFRDGDKEVAALMACTSVRASAAFPQHIDSGFSHTLYTSVGAYADALIEPSLNKFAACRTV